VTKFEQNFQKPLIVTVNLKYVVETIDGTDVATVTQVEDSSTTLAGCPRCPV